MTGKLIFRLLGALIRLKESIALFFGVTGWTAKQNSRNTKRIEFDILNLNNNKPF